jgi:hypothetical protein
MITFAAMLLMPPFANISIREACSKTALAIESLPFKTDQVTSISVKKDASFLR